MTNLKEMVNEAVDIYVRTPRGDFRIEDLQYGLGVSASCAKEIFNHMVACEIEASPESGPIFNRAHLSEVIQLHSN